MPENLGNRCTSCPLVTSVNEKTCQTGQFPLVVNTLQAADNKGYTLFSGQVLSQGERLNRTYEISFPGCFASPSPADG